MQSGERTWVYCGETNAQTHLCENDTLMPLLAILLRSMHLLRWGCWRVFMVRAVVQDIWETQGGGGGVWGGRVAGGEEWVIQEALLRGGVPQYVSQP